MTAQSQYITLETLLWEQELPSSEEAIAQGITRKSPFPIVDLFRAKSLDRLAEVLSQGSSLARQRRAWEIVTGEAMKLDNPPQWCCQEFDTVISRLCFPQTRLAATPHAFQDQVCCGHYLSHSAVAGAWDQSRTTKSSMQIRLHHLWLESHPQRDELTPENLGKGQKLMMALSTANPIWFEGLPPKYRDLIFSVDLGL